jgi:hypothetical protein
MFTQNFLIALPLFLIIAFGYGLAWFGLVSKDMGAKLSKFSFTVTLPILLFRCMCDLRQLPPPNWNIAFAFFGSCFLVFAIGRVFGKYLLKLPADAQTIFGMAGVFSNNVQLGVPLTIALLGREAMPSIAVIFSLNGFLMWLLATIAIEIGRNLSPSIWLTVKKGTISTLKNPIVIGIILGALWGATGFAVGVGLRQYKLTSHIDVTASIAFLKLGLQPCIVFGLCHLFGLGYAETQAATLLSCLPVGVNVYIMANEFNVMQEGAANALLVTTALSAITVPFTMVAFGLF